MNAKIKWIPFDLGGRQKPVDKDVKYCPIIVFKNRLCENANWSAEIYNGTINKEGESIAKISFLVANAPFELFQNGAEFELREGSKLVATGKICTE